MKMSFFSFSERGEELFERISTELLIKRGAQATPELIHFNSSVRTEKDLSACVIEALERSDALIFISSSGIAIRSVAHFLKSKMSDPAIISIDEKGDFVIPLLSGHVGGANALAKELSLIIGAQAIITTATDRFGLFAIDEWAVRSNLSIINPEKIKRVSSKVLRGETIFIYSPEVELIDLYSYTEIVDSEAQADVIISIHESAHEEALHLVPPVLHLGMGARKDASVEAAAQFFSSLLKSEQLRSEAFASLASIDLKEKESAVLSLAENIGLEADFYSATDLEKVEGTHSGSDFVKSVTGVDSVSERAALMKGESLIVPKSAQEGITFAIALSSLQLSLGARKKLSVVGLGAGSIEGMTFSAHEALEDSELIVGYTKYVSLIEDAFSHKELLSTPMKKEIERCEMALQKASEGRVVSMVCSGDAGVYAMASPILELSPSYPEVEIEVIPGVSAAMSGAALLGAPLGHDFATISLSDLLTPWELIEKRLDFAAASDMCISIYNPRSRNRSGYLKKAAEIIARHQSPDLVCGWARHIGRDNQEWGTLKLSDLGGFEADMFTTVFVGNSQTHLISGKMVTPRGYRAAEDG